MSVLSFLNPMNHFGLGSISRTLNTLGLAAELQATQVLAASARNTASAFKDADLTPKEILATITLCKAIGAGSLFEEAEESTK